jgi:histidinol phosphatase-like enzyme (inositol monophosphatase family)
MMVTSPSNAAAFLTCAHALADASGAAITPFFRRPLTVGDKGGNRGFDPVTAADQAAERVMVDLINATFPTHGIVGEEYGTLRPDAPFCWVLDPIDGTRAFIMGLPTWGTLIGLREGDHARLGMMDQPFTRERTWGSAQGAFLRDADGDIKSITTRACHDLTHAMFSSTHPDLFVTPRQQAVLGAIKAKARLTRYGADCYAFGQLAAGHIDVVIEAGLQPYDIVALIPIIEAAGGVVSTFDGKSAIHGGDVLACGDPNIHASVLKLIANL